ncbi:MAG: threonine dehydratase [Parvibaculaceae bacterium]
MTAAPSSLSPDIEPFRFSLPALEAATAIVRQAFPATPQIAWPLLAERTGAEVWVKHENHLPTSAFKVRGGLVLADALKQGRYGKVPRGIITATVGNHGLSQTFAGRKAGFAVTIVVPENNNPEKNKALKALGAELIEAGHDYSAAYEIAARIARERGLFVIEPFLPELMLGVATYALEFFTAVPDLDTVYVPIGMGSGICGLIRTRDLLGLETRIVGVVAENAPAHALSFKAGHVVTTNSAQTFADGVAVRVPKPEPVALIRAGADRVITVSDDEIADAIRFYHEDTHNMAEGAGAVPLAGLLRERERMTGKKVGVTLTGANIHRPLLARILAQ